MRLEGIDEGMVHFINYIRNSMCWFERKLNTHEIKVLFGMLDQAHDKIIIGIKQMVANFNKDDKYGQVRSEVVDEKQDVETSSDSSYEEKLLP